jgi:hypothetical protein
MPNLFACRPASGSRFLKRRTLELQELQNATAASVRWAQAKDPAFVVLDEEAKAGAFAYVGGEFRCLSLFSFPSKPAKRAQGKPKTGGQKRA